MLVSLMAGRAEVKFDPGILSAGAIPPLVQKLGFDAELMDDQALEPGKLDLTVSPRSALIVGSRQQRLHRLQLCSVRSPG